MTTPTTHLVILTGASRGMGLAMAEQLLARPAHTVLCISRHANDALERAPRGAGSELVQWQEDLSDAAGSAQRLGDWLSQSGAAKFASVTLINNAGVIARPAPLDEASAADVVNALRVGVEAPMLLASAFLRATRDWTGARRVLSISSGLGRNAMASQAPYCAAKAGMDHFSRALALEEAARPNGAKVCSLAPGVIDTDMQAQLRGGDPALFPDRERFAQLHAKGQLTSPADAAARVLAYLDRKDFGQNPVADVRDA
jgi:benzil reductase ((S)-benzoin forming)